MFRNPVLATSLYFLCNLTNAHAAEPAPNSSKLDLSLLIKVVDTNHDGCMSHQEWKAAGLPESSYAGLKDKQGCVTLERMNAGSPPPGIDLNGDGKLTVEEFREFDKRMSAKLKSQSQQARQSVH